MTVHVSVLLKSCVSIACLQACFLPGQAKDLSVLYPYTITSPMKWLLSWYWPNVVRNDILGRIPYLLPAAERVQQRVCQESWQETQRVKQIYERYVVTMITVINELCTYKNWVGKSVAHRPDKAFECWQEQCTALTNMCNLDIDFPFAVKWWSLWTFSELPRGKQLSALTNTHIFRHVSGPNLYLVHCNQANALILAEILVIPTFLANVKYCSDFYAEEEFILCAWDTDFCWVSKVSCVGRVRKLFWINLRELSNFGEQIFKTVILNFGCTLGYKRKARQVFGSTTKFKPFICYVVIV